MRRDKNCAGCDDWRKNCTDDCCDLKFAADSLPARCVGIWSEDKLHYFRRYCGIFATGMKNKWRNRVFVDMFAGPGRCRLRPTGEFVDGSPLIALSNDFTHYYFVDMSPHCIHALTKRVDQFKEAKEVVHVFPPSDCNEIVSEVHAKVSSLGSHTLGFAFLDPPGIELHFDTIRTLSRDLKLDLLINFPLGMNIKRQFKHQLERESRMDLYFGSSDWKRFCESNEEAPIGAKLLQFYEDNLRSLGYDFVGDAQTVRHPYQHAPLYHLIFASKNPKGEEFWAKVTKITPSGQRRLL